MRDRNLQNLDPQVIPSPSVVKRWGRSGGGNRKWKGLIGGVKVPGALCVSYPRGLEQVGLVRRRNWVDKRKRRVQKDRGVAELAYVGVLLRGSWRTGGRRHSHSMNLSCNTELSVIQSCS